LPIALNPPEAERDTHTSREAACEPMRKEEVDRVHESNERILPGREDLFNQSPRCAVFTGVVFTSLRGRVAGLSLIRIVVGSLIESSESFRVAATKV